MEKDFLDDLVVVKRSGQRVSFNDAKIALAVKKGLIAYMKNTMKRTFIRLKKKF